MREALVGLTCTNEAREMRMSAQGGHPVVVRRTGLAQRRKAVGFTQEQLAERVGVERSTVVRWEAGSRAPLPYQRPKLARVLRLSVDQLNELLVVDASEPPSPPATPPVSGGVLLPVIINGRSVLVPLDAETVANSGLGAYLDEARSTGYLSSSHTPLSEGEAMSPLSRRSLLTHGIAAAALPALGLEQVQQVAAAMSDPHRYLDGSVISYLSHQLTACKANDGNSGPAAALPLVLGILDAIEQHARAVTPDIRRALLRVGADGAEFAGWLYRDLHDSMTASFWHGRATEWAQEAGDMPMQGYILLKKSQMAYEQRDALRVLTLAQAAQNTSWQLPPKVRAEVTQQEARGLAMIGEPLRLVEQKLDDARQLIDASDNTDEHQAHLGTYYNEGTHMLRAASCYIEAGKPGHAAELYGGVLTSGVLSRRDEGYFRARHAAALALSGQPDDAAQEGLAAMQLAAEIQSSRTRQELKRVVSTLEPWNNRPGPRALREAVSN